MVSALGVVKSARASPLATRIWLVVIGRLVEDTGAAPFVYAAGEEKESD